MNLCTHAYTPLLLTAVKQVNLCVRLRHWQRCLYVESTLSALRLSSHLRAPKPISFSLPLFTIHALLFTCSERQADKPIPACIFLLTQTRRKQTHRDQSRETSSTGYQTPSQFWRIDYRCQRTQIQCGFFSSARNPVQEDFVLFFPHPN